MTQQELKTKLLNTGYFEDDGYYINLYCDLVINNLNTQKEKYKTQCHHILPKCYFQLIEEEIDNSRENLVHLLYVDHMLAHKYMYKFSIGSLKRRLANAMIRFYSRTFKNYSSALGDIKDRQLLYEECMKEIAELSRELNAIPVQCLETGEVFASPALADIHYKGYITTNVAASARKLEKGLNHKAYGFHWIRLLDKIPLNDKEREEKLNSLPPIKKGGTPLGSKRSSSTGILLSQKLTGQKRNDEVKQHMIDAWKDPTKHTVKGHKKKKYKSPEEIKEELKLKELKKKQNAEKIKERNKLGKFHLNHPHTEETKELISSKMSIPVQNLETGEVYKNSKEADLIFRGKHTTNVERSCIWLEKGLNKKAYGYHWVRLKNNIAPYNEQERLIILNSLSQNNYGSKKVKCIETGEIFNSVGEASIKYKCAVSNHLHNVSKTAGGYHWEFVKEGEKDET